MYHSGDQVIKNLAFEDGGSFDPNGGCAMRLRCQNKSSAYTLKASDSGTWFTTLGQSGALTFTLPVFASKGTYYYVVASTADDVVIASATADLLVAYADATATSVTITNIGVVMMVFFNGTSWHAVSFGAVSGSAITVT